MMIQVSNPLSLLSGTENAAVGQQGSLTDGGGNAAFTSSLQQQLALLQGNLPTSTNIDATTSAGVGVLTGEDNVVAGQSQSMQNFAALFGKALPTAKKIGQGIDLDDTMSALSDVLQHLQGLENVAEDSTQSVQAAGVNEQITTAAKESQTEGADSAIQAAQMLAQATAIPAVMGSAQQSTSENVSGESSEGSSDNAESTLLLKQQHDQQTAKDENANSAALAAVAAAMQQPAQQTVTKDVAGEALATIGIVDKDMQATLNKAAQSASVGSTMVGAGLAQAAEDKQTSLAWASEMADAMYNQDSDAHSAGQEKQATLKAVEDDLAVTATQTKSVETDKNPNRLAADIAQLNQAVSTDKTVQVPAMSRPLSHPEWNTELGEKLVWMHKQAVPSAELRINPQHLGPISIKVDVDNDQASVSFTAQHAGVKDAIEAAIPKLREMLSGQQLNLVDVNVSQQQSEQRQPRDFFQAAGEQGRGNNQGQNDETENPTNPAAIDIVDEIEAGRAIASNGLLSLFA